MPGPALYHLFPAPAPLDDARMVDEMTRQAARHVRRRRTAQPDPRFDMVLRQIFANMVAMIAAGLEALVRNGNGAKSGRPLPPP